MRKHPTPAQRAGTALAVALALLLGTALAGPVQAAEGVVNVNTATAAELEILPGIGEAKARAIVEHRKRHGAFQEIDALRDVPGIGDAALERIRGQVVIQGKTTLRE